MAKRPALNAPKLNPDQVRQIEQTVFPLAEGHLPEQFYLLAVEFVRETGMWFLRIYIEGKGFRVSLSDCEQVSRLIDPLMDTVAELQNLSYSLEVSSPGLFRPLKTARELAFYKGAPIRLETTGAALPASEGVLEDYQPETHQVVLKNPHTQELTPVSLNETITLFLNPEVKFPESSELGGSIHHD